MKNIKLKRVYEAPSSGDGYRVLVDRLWPRGLKKEAAQVDEWMKEIAPSHELRKWFGHRADRFEEFGMRYRVELADKTYLLNQLRQMASKIPLCLLYAAKDMEINHAIILRQVLLENEYSSSRSGDIVS